MAVDRGARSDHWGVEVFFEDNGKKTRIDPARRLRVFDRPKEHIDDGIFAALLLIGDDVRRHIRAFVRKGEVTPELTSFTIFGRIGTNPEWDTGGMLRSMQTKIINKATLIIGIPMGVKKASNRPGKRSKISLGLQAIYQSKGYSFTVTPRQARYMRFLEMTGEIPPGTGNWKVGNVINVPARNFFDQAAKTYIPSGARVLAAGKIVEQHLARSLREGMR